MPSSTLRRDSSESQWPLWIGLIAGPIVWAALLATNYVMSYVACEQRHSWMLHTASSIAIVIVIAAGAMVWRIAPPFADEPDPSTNPHATAAIVERFLAICGIAFCAWFLVAILALEIPPLVLGPCQ